MKTERFDFVIIGSGFGGSITGMVLRRLGKSVLLLERASHPRFAIGESSTPFANLLLERLAAEYDLPFLRSLSEWGRWQETFPEIPAGLKRGFTFYHHSPGDPVDFTNRATQLLVAASPNDRVADTHWYRPAFDEFLVRKARELGVEYRDRVRISEVQNSSGGWEMTVTSGLAGDNPSPGFVEDEVRGLSKEPKTFRAAASFLIDATGPGGFHPLGNALSAYPFMPDTCGVYAHFRDVPRLDHLAPELRNNALPYPPDDAAVHHIFPGGWIWVLRFNNGITSAGAALSRRSAGYQSAAKPSGKGPVFGADYLPLDSKNASVEPRKLWHSILQRLPTLAETFASAVPISPFYFAPRLSFRRDRAAGANWAALPSSAGFVDPLLSTGFALTLLGIARLGASLKHSRPDLTSYQTQTFHELEASADLVSALYAKMNSPREFTLLTLLYFAAMSFTETAWRLSKPELASGFLLTNDANFSAARGRICAQARGGESISRDAIAAQIERYDVAGLTDWSRNNWYPVAPGDLVSSANKLQASPAEVENLLKSFVNPKYGRAESVRTFSF